MLYIVGTPIGNVEDTSLRAVKTLAESDVILAEDTAAFDSYYSRLQKLFNIIPQKKQQFIHFHKENEFEKLPQVIKLIENARMVSLVSESGLPTISDPGHVLVKYLTSTNTRFTVIPGPTAFTTAAILSGFPTGQILFLGFLPKKESQIVQMFKQLNVSVSKHINPTIVFYESPHRIKKTLQLIGQELPNATVAIAREMTKKFEKVVRGKADEVSKRNLKGEITVVMTIER